MTEWALLTNHGRALACLARDPDMRLRELASCLDVTERAAQRIVTELCETGHVTKERNGRRNHYRLVGGRVIAEPALPGRTIDQLVGFVTADGHVERRRVPDRRRVAGRSA
jgi:predicted ArsR family transcriptional regulator